MNTRTILAVAALLAAGSTFAADTNEAAFDQAFRNNSGASTLTREQVKAQTIAARKAGLLDTNEAYQDIAYMAPRPKSAEVKAQLAAKAAAQGNTAQ
ncbi:MULTISPECIES: DUF4148 domain-containing protein [unclassified Duganella]|jgi:hypothetical protein|uniref:DUF4148 domain-containing protein n=1 Tax=unclassified Duganella TaxID=2636909 RepID=UPI000885E309|nr:MULTISPECIES: DUF4148 domain-containing protein [unclassified Duganella]SDH49844.1 protein of unknown function [Duganella sp. OV458]SDK63537.1 protein of unknown function [Duganella sp. OV510]